MVSLFLLLGCNLSDIVDLFAALHELASASARTLLKLASSVRALLKPYGDTLSSFMRLVPAHVRVARQSNDTRVDKTRGVNFVPCEGLGESTLTEVSCRKVSLGCSLNVGYCDEKYTACTINGKLKDFVTGCECR